MLKRLLTMFVMAVVCLLAVTAQNNRSVRGTVYDENGEPIIGATVSVPGTDYAVVTDMDGKFAFPWTSAIADKQLLVSYVGMKTQTIKLADAKMPLNIKLVPDTNVLDDVIVTGYTTLSKERATGSFGTIKAEKLEAKLATNLMDRLEGQIAGVVIDKDGGMTIRGLSTLNAESKPLVVVDGYPTELTLSELNPDNIENITVLKDAVAASIYGSRSANGVIVVTSKQGRDGRMKVSYRGTLAIKPRPDLNDLHMAGTSDYIDAELDVIQQSDNSYQISKRSTNQSLVEQLYVQRKAGMITSAEFDQRIADLRNINFLKQMEENMFRTSLSQTHNIGLSGGNPTNRYNLAINYNHTRGNYINTSSDRLLIDLNNEWKPFKFLTIGVATSLNYNTDKSPIVSWQTYTDFNSYTKPYTQLVDASGNPVMMNTLSYATEQLYAGISGGKDMGFNPIIEAYDNYRKNQNFTARVNAFIRWNIWEDLNAEVGGSWSRGSSTYKAIREADSYVMRLAYNGSTSISNPVNHYVPDGDMIDETRYNNEYWTLRSQITYAKSFGLHRVSFLGGNEIRQTKYDNNTYATRFGYNQVAGSFTPLNLVDLSTGVNKSDMIAGSAGVSPNYGSYSLRDNRFVSWYMNGSYEYNNRYLVSGSIRWDKTNFFGTDPKYRNKPLWSVGGTWKVNNEDFFDVSWVNRLNLRASYGLNGNISLSEGPYMILSAGSFNSTTGGVSYGISSYPNNSLRWEKTKTVNLGVDFDVLAGRLGMSFDYYNKKSTDILARDATDPTTGTSAMMKNVGSIRNEGFEISLHGTPVRTRDFSWDVIYNISLNKNKVLEYNVARNYSTSWAWYSPVHAKGRPMYGLYGYRFAGINDKGQTMIYDPNNEKKLASACNVDDIVYLGSGMPKTDMSLTNTFRYRNWDLSFMFIAKLGHKIRRDVFQGSNTNSRYVGQRWQKPGDEAHTNYPSLAGWNMDIFYYPFLDINTVSGDYLKLRDLTLAYTFSKSLLSNIGMTDARIYLQARNLFRITANDYDIDPETQEFNYGGGGGATSNAGYAVLPRNAEYYIGVTFSF